MSGVDAIAASLLPQAAAKQQQQRNVITTVVSSGSGSGATSTGEDGASTSGSSAADLHSSPNSAANDAELTPPMREGKPNIWELNNASPPVTTIGSAEGRPNGVLVVVPSSAVRKPSEGSTLCMASSAIVSPSGSSNSGGGSGTPHDDAGQLINFHGDVSSTGGDAEGVWSADIEQAFQEALAIYPPCGRRKIILSDEGKMYGRNELIARYIKLRTGKTRTRKQVSSHIQVLARKKQREIQSRIKGASSKEKAVASLSRMSSAQIVSLGTLEKEAVVSAALQQQQDGQQQQQAHNFSPVVTTVAQPSPISTPLYPAPGATVASPLWRQSFGSYGSRPMTSVMTSVQSALTLAGLPLLSVATTPSSSHQQRLPFNVASLTSPSPTSAATVALLAAAASHHPLVVQPAAPPNRVGTDRIQLCHFSAYVENKPDRHEFVRIDANSFRDPIEHIDITQFYDKYPSDRDGLRDLYENGPKDAFFLVKFWADISFTPPSDEREALYCVDSRYESNDSVAIVVSTKVCSFGKQVVEKVESEYAIFEQSLGRFVYRISQSPMCEYMVKFIHQLKKLNDASMMNSVLDNFTVLQLVTNKETRETLLCIAFVFEVSAEGPSDCTIFRLVPPSSNNSAS